MKFVIVERWDGSEAGFFMEDLAWVHFTDKVRPHGLVDEIEALIYFRGAREELGVSKRGLEQLQKAMAEQELP